MKRTLIKRTGFKQKDPRKPLARRTELKRSDTPLAYASPRTKAERPQRQAVIALVHERDNEQCQAAELVPSIQCGGRLDVHERWSRGRFPGSHLHAEAAILCCRIHHAWIGLNVTEAETLGLLMKSGQPQPSDQDADR